MSWPQRVGNTAPAHPQRPLQGYNNQQNMYPNYQGQPPPAANAQQQYWQAQQPQYNQQYGQAFQQQDYGNNANQFYQQPQFNQNYTSQQYPSAQQQQYQQNYYPNQGAPPQGFQAQPKTDSWEDNWDWGWGDESAKQAQQAAVQNQAPTSASQPLPQQVYNNANVIEESFASTDTWNWSTEEKKNVTDSAAPTQPMQQAMENKSAVEIPPQRIPSNSSTHAPDEEVRSLSDREVVKERLPNLALGKRMHLENLTPQWSIESQMSQESSDGPQTHSEGTYRSDNQSRNSSKSSPGLNTENSNFNFSQSAIDEYTPSNEWSQHSNEASTLVDNNENSSRRESHVELSNSLQEMSIVNRENLASESLGHREPEHVPPPSVSSATLPAPTSAFMAGATPSANSMPPAPPVTSGAGVPPSLSSSGTLLPPPTSFPQTSSSTNPFKQSGPFSHKKIASASPSLQSLPPTSGTNLTSPNVVSKGSQHRVPVGFGANLETTPDNSERPDLPQMSAFRPSLVPEQVPDNLEVAPQNDRNEYMQTAHLSGGDYGDNSDFVRNIPPPGLRRMVVGQQESEYSQNLNISGDEPPPGLSRMVPGQQTEADNSYNQPSDDYLDRHIDGQPMETIARPYRQADGQQTPENYTQPPSTRGPERRPIGLDRMVPGEPSNDEYPQYQSGNYAVNEQRVVTGVDHDYPIQADAGPSDIREQNMDGSDYSEPTPRTSQRNVMCARNDPGIEVPQEEQQREVIMEGENLQDLSVISSDTYTREPTFDGADLTVTDAGADRRTDLSDSLEHGAANSRRQSLNRVNTSGEESDRDRAFKSSPRRDRDKHMSSRDRDREREKEGRYSRGDKKLDRERDERRSGRDKERSERERDRERDRDRDWDRERRERDESPHSRRHRRSTRSRRYETEDTDYYSDRERDRRSHREGSYASKPPRPEDKDRRHRESSRRYGTSERERRERRDRDRHRERGERDERERYEARYRDIDPSRKHGNLRAEREDEERRRGELYSSASRPESREATDEELNETLGSERRRDRRSRHARPDRDPYYDSYLQAGGADPYEVQRQQYEYYEQLRRSDPHAYLLLYKQLLAGKAPARPLRPKPAPLASAYAMGWGGGGRVADERGSVHSGRSSANGLKGNDTYYLSALGGLRADTASLRDAPSLRTDFSDRELNTDASLNLQLEESTARSERMTPFKYSTAHVKASISSRDIVLVRPSYPVDGLPATVHVVSLAAAAAPAAAHLLAYPGPLAKGVTHKKSVIEYCTSRIRNASKAAPRDAVGYVLVWELLALLLRQNGVVVGTDIAELLMKNKSEYEYKVSSSSKNSTQNGSRRGSAQSAREEGRASPPPPRPAPPTAPADRQPQEESTSPGQPPAPADERAALDRLREYLTYGNRQEALEWAMSCGLWGHALQLAGGMERRTRALVAARFLHALPATDPLHSLYAHLQARQPPAATCVSEERWGDWRPHAAIMLANSSAKPEQDVRTITQLGDSLLSRGLLYSAQFCYVSAGVGLGAHPLAPHGPPGPPPPTPRLALLLADARAPSLRQLATDEAIFATEIYEYAMSLSQDFVIQELQVYKLILATRLVDAGLYERAFGYLEAIAAAIERAPHAHGPSLAAVVGELAERLARAAGLDAPALESAPGDSAEPSPRPHHPLHHLQAETSVSQQSSPQHSYYSPPPPPPAPYSGWPDQAQQQQQPSYQQQQAEQVYGQPADGAGYYPAAGGEYPAAAGEAAAYGGGWHGAPAPAPQVPADAHASYDSYWQGDGLYSYGETSTLPAGGGGEAEGAGAGGAEGARPAITMPGAARAQAHAYNDYEDERAPSPDQQHEGDKQGNQKQGGKRPEGKGGEGKGSGWLGGILTKLSLRAPNQMILPDDSNPTIVWDPERKRWRNTDADSEAEGEQPPPPPPTSLPHLPKAGSAAPPGPPAAGAPPAAPVSNIFKMQRGRHIKKSYVDVFNPAGAPTRPLPPAADVLGPAPAAAPAPAYFIPAPAPAPAHQMSVSQLLQPLRLTLPRAPAPAPAPVARKAGMFDPTEAAGT